MAGEERDIVAAFGEMIQRGMEIQAERRQQEHWARVRAEREARLNAMFGQLTRDEVRALWDSFEEETSFCGPYDCADVHGYLNLIGDGEYCAV